MYESTNRFVVPGLAPSTLHLHFTHLADSFVKSDLQQDRVEHLDIYRRM